MSENLKEALEYAVELANNEQKVLKLADERVYVDSNTFHFRELNPKRYPPVLQLSTLDSFIDYLKTDLDKLTNKRILVIVKDPQTVVALEELDDNEYRADLVTVDAMIPTIYFGKYENAADFNILLQSRFVNSDDREAVLSFASALKIEKGTDIIDDGVAQITTIKDGVASLAKAKAPNPVTLRPYRTFSEVKQPASQFIFRINSQGQMALFEADGGQWRLEAVQTIAAYLKAALTETEHITILA